MLRSITGPLPERPAAGYGRSRTQCRTPTAADLAKRPATRYTEDVCAHEPGFPRRRRAAFALLCTLALAGAAGRSAAGLTVSIAEFSFIVHPEGRVAASFVVANDAPYAVTLDIAVTDWDETPDDVTLLLPVGSVDRSCGRWLEVGASRLVLAAFEEAEVVFAARVPPGARGTYWAGVAVREIPSTASVPGNAFILLPEAIVRVFVDVPPTTSAAAVTWLAVTGTRPFCVEIRIENSGDARLRFTSAVVTIDGPEGTQRALALPFATALPGRIVALSAQATWDIDLPGLHIIRAVLDFGGDTLIAGQVAVRVP